MRITRKYEWDMGHRVPQHKSKCRNVHGHRYVGEFTLEGGIVKGNSSDDGMVMDFGDIKGILSNFIDTKLDHGYMGQTGIDKTVLNFLEGQGYKNLPVSFTPTAENIAQFLLDELGPLFKDTYGTGLKLVKVRLWETPNSVAEVEL